MSSFVLCVGCGEPLYGFSPCRWCTCERCGIDMRDGFCPLCNSRNSCVYDPNPNSFDCPPDSYHPPHPTYETYSGDSCGIDSHLGYDCPPQFPLNYEPEPGYIQNYYTIAITPVLSTKEPVDSLSMGDEHLYIISATESDEVIKSSVEDLIPIPKVMEIVIPEVGGIDDDILLTIKDDNLREKLLNVHLLIANIEALKANPTLSSKILTKSSSTSPKYFLKEKEISSGSTTTHFDISLSDYEAFSFNNDHIKEICSGSTTTHFDISLSDYEAFSFNNDHIKEICSGSTTTHFDISLLEYDSFTFDLSNDQCPPTDRSDFTHEE
nr:pre-mRNA splicing Prp18-interacting factor [Tanacetum cinerariifolium]